MQDLRSTIRKEIRKKRNNLTNLTQHIGSKNVLSQLKKLPILESAQNIAIYLSADGELNTQPIIEYLWQKKINVYLPVIHPFSKGFLLFLKYDPNTEMVKNRFNIQEPKLNQTQIIPIAQLDLIFTPLVAFDENGQRLGMGGGYYDRSLEKWFKTGKGAIPIGIAHDCQRVDNIPNEEWDVPLSMIITPSKVWEWPSTSLGN